MNFVSKLKCSQNNDAARVCYSQGCNYSPIMCEDVYCQCQNVHNQCEFTQTLIYINSLLNAKGTCYESLFHEIIDWYQYQIKQFTINLEHIKALIGDQLNLEEAEQKFYSLIRSGNSSQMTSQIIQSMIKCLVKNPIFPIQNKKEQVKKKLEQKNKQIETILKQMRKLQKSILYKPPQQIDGIAKIGNFVHQSIKITGNKVKKVTNTDGDSIALLNISIQNYQNAKQIYKFRIMNDTGISLGFCHLNHAQKSKFTDDCYQRKGAYVVCSNGSIYSNCKQNKVYLKLSSGLHKKDIVQITYDPHNGGYLIFNNVTKNSFLKILIQKLPGNPIYPCIMLAYLSQVEYLGMKLIN